MNLQVNIYRKNAADNTKTLIHVQKYPDWDKGTFTRQCASNLLEDLVVEGICNENDAYEIVSPYLTSVHWGKRSFTKAVKS